MALGDRHAIPVAVLEFTEGGTTLWVHNDRGMTVLRIKCARVVVSDRCANPAPHADMIVDGDIEVCIP